MSRTVLVVDDDREVQRYLSESLEAQGWRVICEKDGEWALKTFQSRDVDAVILDILIPVVNGFQVAEAIRKSPRGQKVGIIMLTGIYRGASHRAEAIRRYALLDYLDKPVEASRLVDLLHEHFARLPASPPPKATGRDKPGKARGGSRYADAAQRREKREVEKAAQRLEAGEAGVRGNLKRVPFPRLLNQLYVKRASGALFLLKDKVKKIVYFRDGHPIYIKSNLLNECLGRVLVRERMISAGECDESLKRMKETKRQQGTVLIEMGVISPHNLKYALELQLQIKLFDIFGWTVGEFQFKDDAKLPNEVIALDLPNGAIVLEGIRRAYDSERLSHALGPYRSAFLMPAADPSLRFQEMPLEDDEREFLDRIDGSATLKEYVQSSTLGELRTEQLLHALLCAGVIEPTEAATREGGLPPEDEAAVAAAHRQRHERQQRDGSQAATDEPQPLPPPPMPGRGRSVTGERPVVGGRPSAPATRTSELPGRERLAANLLSLRQQDHFAALGLELNAPPAVVESAYAERARDYHPDRFRHRSEDTRVIAREIFERLSDAYRVLSDPHTRDSYVTQLARGESAPPPMEPAGRALAADKHFRSGEEFLRQRRFAEAAAAFAKACELVPEAGEYHAYSGWATFQANPHDAKAQGAAQASLKRGVGLSPRTDRTHLFLGYFLNQVGRTSQAEREFELAIQCNPDCAEALRELRLINARRTHQTLRPSK